MTGRRALLFGATGTIGRAATQALVERGHEVAAVIRPQAVSPPAAARVLRADATDPASLAAALNGERFDVAVSCLASRTGAPRDAWAIDHAAQLNALAAARAAGAEHFVLLSAICVQKPRLAFQHAKLAFEAALRDSGLDWTIVRPTAYFKSLSGQLDRVRAGKPYLLFGDGRLTACKPISDADLGRFLADCVAAGAARNQILPLGGPGPAITPLEQGEKLFELLGRRPRFSRAPVALMDAIIAALSGLGAFSASMADKAEFARIARYYATESMLVFNPVSGRYDAEATPSYGAETLFDHYAALVRGDAMLERGDHALF